MAQVIPIRDAKTGQLAGSIGPGKAAAPKPVPRPPLVRPSKVFAVDPESIAQYHAAHEKQLFELGVSGVQQWARQHNCGTAVALVVTNVNSESGGPYLVARYFEGEDGAPLWTREPMTHDVNPEDPATIAEEELNHFAVLLDRNLHRLERLPSPLEADEMESYRLEL